MPRKKSLANSRKDSSMLNFIIGTPLDTEISMGKGHGVANRIGNKQYHEFIVACVPQYNALTKMERSKFFKEMVVILKKEQGRFFDTDEASGRYYEVCDRVAQAKVGQAIRYAAATAAAKKEVKTKQAAAECTTDKAPVVNHGKSQQSSVPRCDKAPVVKRKKIALKHPPPGSKKASSTTATRRSCRNKNNQVVLAKGIPSTQEGEKENPRNDSFKPGVDDSLQDTNRGHTEETHFKNHKNVHHDDGFVVGDDKPDEVATTSLAAEQTQKNVTDTDEAVDDFMVMEAARKNIAQTGPDTDIGLFTFTKHEIADIRKIVPGVY